MEIHLVSLLVEAWTQRLNKISFPESEFLEEATRQKKATPAEMSLNFVANLIHQRGSKALDSPAPVNIPYSSSH